VTHTSPRTRARNVGIRIGVMDPGKWNAVTDVPGVKVGHVTILDIRPGERRAATGVTAVLPHGGNLFTDPVPAACFVMNGFGKTVGLPQVEETGLIETPVLLTGTLNVWRVADYLVDYMLRHNTTASINPVVGECNDGHLNDAPARHVKREHVFRALETAASGPVAEGSVGAGTGMTAFGFKAGVGTASRRVRASGGTWTVGVLLVNNLGSSGREFLVIDGVPVGRELASGADRARGGEEKGSIMIIAATDAPFSSRQLGRIARRAVLGTARVGANAGHGSGDFVICFSTARGNPAPLSDREIDPFFRACAEATEEAMVDSLLAAQPVPVPGRNVPALPLDRLRDVMEKYGKPLKNPGDPEGA